MEIIFIAGAFVAGVGVGAGGYRYFLKRNPAALEALAAKIKQAADKVLEKAES